MEKYRKYDAEQMIQGIRADFYGLRSPEGV
jgi:hypothetical protein